MKKIILSFISVVLLSLGAATVSAQTAPKSVIHIVTVKWKEGTTEAQIKAALDGVQKLPAAYKGITRVWTRAIKVQGDKTHVMVMEFADEAALAAYTDSAAQKEWYLAYLPIRDASTTFDVTN